MRDEGPEQAGYAHLAENLMFDGSANVQPGAHLRLVSQTGGDASSDTEDDITRFYEVLPSNQLALGLWLEADRLRSLTLNDTAVTVERRVMRDERRYRVRPAGLRQPIPARHRSSLRFDHLLRLRPRGHCRPRRCVR